MANDKCVFGSELMMAAKYIDRTFIYYSSVSILADFKRYRFFFFCEKYDLHKIWILIN